MNARPLEGRPVGAKIREAVRQQALAFQERAGRAPHLAAVLVGKDEAGLTYARAKQRTALECGLDFRLHELPATTDTDAVVALLRMLSSNPDVDAILVELPLPPSCDLAAVTAALDPSRDADGITADSLGRLLMGRSGPRPATAMAVMELLAAFEVPLEGVRAVVVGRSTQVGLPAALLLLRANATVTVAHSRTPDLAQVTRQADVLVVAAGRPALITAEHVRPGATVIDVGTTVVHDTTGSRLVGDVDPQAWGVAGQVSPVPGGVGPVTTAVLLRNAVELAWQRLENQAERSNRR